MDCNLVNRPAFIEGYPPNIQLPRVLKISKIEGLAGTREFEDLIEVQSYHIKRLVQ